MNSGLKVLVIAHDHPAWTPGGTEHVAFDLARALDATPGVTARLLVAGTRLHRPESRAGGLEAIGQDFVLITGAYDRFTMLRHDGADWLDSLSRVLDSVRPDVVHLHGLDRLGAEILPALRRFLPTARIVLTLHDFQVTCARDGLLLNHDGVSCPGPAPDRCHRCLPDIPASRHALRRAHLSAILRIPDQIVAPGRHLQDHLVDWGVDPSRIRTIANGVEAGGTVPVANDRAVRNRFAMFGNIAPHKGVLVLLRAAARPDVRDARLEVSLHGGLGWADEGFRASFARALDAAMPVAQHLGPYPRAEVASLMRRADWIVVPSIWPEVAPLTILEAQAAGRPVICAGHGGMAELVVHGENGLHVPPGDAHALAATMVRASQDRDLWDRLAGAARAMSFTAHVAEHLELYHHLVGQMAA